MPIRWFWALITFVNRFRGHVGCFIFVWLHGFMMDRPIFSYIFPISIISLHWTCRYHNLIPHISWLEFVGHGEYSIVMILSKSSKKGEADEGVINKHLEIFITVTFSCILMDCNFYSSYMNLIITFIELMVNFGLKNVIF